MRTFEEDGAGHASGTDLVDRMAAVGEGRGRRLSTRARRAADFMVGKGAGRGRWGDGATRSCGVAEICAGMMGIREGLEEGR